MEYVEKGDMRWVFLAETLHSLQQERIENRLKDEKRQAFENENEILARFQDSLKNSYDASVDALRDLEAHGFVKLEETVFGSKLILSTGHFWSSGHKYPPFFEQFELSLDPKSYREKLGCKSYDFVKNVVARLKAENPKDIGAFKPYEPRWSERCASVAEQFNEHMRKARNSEILQSLDAVINQKLADSKQYINSEEFKELEIQARTIINKRFPIPTYSWHEQYDNDDW